MKRIWNFLQPHAVAIGFAVVVGLLSVAPHLLAAHALGSDYRGIPFLYLDDEDIYLARIQEIVDGHWPVSSAFFYEYKSSSDPVMLPFAESIYAAGRMVFGIPLPQVLVITKFFFPALLFLLAYALSKRLMSGGYDATLETSAIAGGLLVTLGYDFVYDVPRVFAILRGLDPGLLLSVWTRPVNPITGGLLLFVFLITLWEVVRRRSSLLWLPAGLLLGVMVSYFFSWGMALSILCVLIIMFALRQDWPRVKSLSYSLITGFLTSGAYWLLLGHRFVPGDDAPLLRFGLFYTHVPLLNKALLAVIVVCGILTAFHAFRAKRLQALREIAASDWWLFCAAVLIGALWAFSQQIITGRTIWPYHFVQYSKPLSSVVLMVVAYHFFRPVWPRIWRFGISSFIVLMLVGGAALASTYRSQMADFEKVQRYADTFDWLNTKGQKDCVVLVKEEGEPLTRLITAFTHCNVYRSSWVFAGVPAERILHNYFVYLRIEGVTPEHVKEYLTLHPDDVRILFFDNWKQLFTSGSSPWLELKIEEASTGYADFYGRDFVGELSRYRLDYLLSQEPLSPDDRRMLGITREPEHVGVTYIYSY